MGDGVIVFSRGLQEVLCGLERGGFAARWSTSNGNVHYPLVGDRSHHINRAQRASQSKTSDGRPYIVGQEGMEWRSIQETSKSRSFAEASGRAHVIRRQQSKAPMYQDIARQQHGE